MVRARLESAFADLAARPLRACAGALCGLVVLAVLAVLTEPGQLADAKLFGWVQYLGPGPLERWLPALARRVLPPLLALTVVLLGVVGLVRRTHGLGAVLAALAVVALSVAVDVVLRGLLPRPQHGYGYLDNTLPSTHATAVLALLVGVWWLAPRRTEWLARVLVGVGLLGLLGNVVGHAHLPSDVVASALVVGMVTGAVVGARAHVRRGRR